MKKQRRKRGAPIPARRSDLCTPHTARVHSAAAIATVTKYDRSARAERQRRQFVISCPEIECEAARVELLPYEVPPSCRIEVLADMKRVATDCRRELNPFVSPWVAILD